MFESKSIKLGKVELPNPNNIRVQMMPFYVHDVNHSLPEQFNNWKSLLNSICNRSGEYGTGFLTIDEAYVIKGEYHRRPGLHVDCGGPLLAHGGSSGHPASPDPRHSGSPLPDNHGASPSSRHGGSPPGHGGSPPRHGASAGGMFTVASSVGCRGWNQIFDGIQGEDGDCAHLKNDLKEHFIFEENILYWCNSHLVHETLPAHSSGMRQFLRVSMPSDAPWHSNYTENPLGIKPAGSIVYPRSQMNYRS